MDCPYKWKFNYQKELKILWQKEKLLIMSNFFICHNLFKSRQNAPVGWKGWKIAKQKINLFYEWKFDYWILNQIVNIEGKRRNCSMYTIAPYVTIFTKVIWCRCVKMHPHVRKLSGCFSDFALFSIGEIFNYWQDV